MFDVDGEPVMRDGVQMRRAAMHFQVLKASMHELGIDTCKEQPPSEDLELLGVALSLREQRMRLAPGKRVKYAAMALDVAQRKVVERETLLELLGRLNFAATFYPMVYVLQRVSSVCAATNTLHTARVRIYLHIASMEYARCD